MVEMTNVGLLGVCFGFSVMCVSIAAYYIAAEWFKTQQVKIEVDLKREMIQKGLSTDEIERVLKSSTDIRPAKEG
jgi:hypothetical protein